MKSKYDYVGALATNVIFLRDSKTKIKRVLRKLVRESLLCTVRPKADGKHYEVYEAWANRIARRMVP